MRKNSVIQRLNIVKGQTEGLIRLIEKKESCQRVTEQFYAINSGLKKTIESYLRENLTTCVKSLNLKKRKTIEFLLKEIVKNK